MSFVDSVLVFDARAKVRLLFALDKNRTKLLQEKTSVLDWVILSGELKNARIKKKIVLHFIFSLPAFLFLALETVPNERGKLIMMTLPINNSSSFVCKFVFRNEEEV